MDECRQPEPQYQHRENCQDLHDPEEVCKGGREKDRHERGGVRNGEERRVYPCPDTLMGSLLQHRLRRHQDERVAKSKPGRHGRRGDCHRHHNGVTSWPQRIHEIADERQPQQRSASERQGDVDQPVSPVAPHHSRHNHHADQDPDARWSDDVPDILLAEADNASDELRPERGDHQECCLRQRQVSDRPHQHRVLEDVHQTLLDVAHDHVHPEPRARHAHSSWRRGRQGHHQRGAEKVDNHSGHEQVIDSHELHQHGSSSGESHQLRSGKCEIEQGIGGYELMTRRNDGNGRSEHWREKLTRDAKQECDDVIGHEDRLWMPRGLYEQE